MHQDNEFNRFGRADFVGTDDLLRAGMFRQTPDSIFLGFHNGRALWYSGAGGMAVFAGARAGKFRDLLAYLLCSSILRTNTLVLDPKGEGAVVSQDQTADRKFVFFWNPSHLHGLHCDSINPLDFAHRGNPNLVSDIKTLIAQAIPSSGSAQSEYFEQRARDVAEAVCLVLVEREDVLTLPSLYEVINLIPANNAQWIDFAYLMHTSDHPIARRVEAEIADSRKDSSGGFKGIIGELLKAFSCLSDPALMASVSPPYRFSFADMCKSGQAYQIYLMPPAEYISAWSPVIKMMFTSALIHKARAPEGPRQTWLMDECALLQKFPLLTQSFTYGAGIGVRPVAIFQSVNQMKAIGPSAETVIPASAACQMYFGVRDLETANRISSMLGSQSLYFDDNTIQAPARQAKDQAMRAFLNGEDPMRTGLDYIHSRQQSEQRSVQHRKLMTPDEVLNMGARDALVFTDGLPGAARIRRIPYFETRWMAGRFHPNPYHPPADRVRCKGVIGSHWRRVVKAPVEPKYAHFPQYRSGIRSRIVR